MIEPSQRARPRVALERGERSASPSCLSEAATPRRVRCITVSGRARPRMGLTERMAHNLPAGRSLANCASPTASHGGSMTMKTPALWLAASLAIATSACVRTHTNEASGAVDVDIESPTKKGEDWSGNLSGQGMYAAVTGKATALSSEGRTSITLTLDR